MHPGDHKALAMLAVIILAVSVPSAFARSLAHQQHTIDGAARSTSATVRAQNAAYNPSGSLLFNTTAPLHVARGAMGRVLLQSKAKCGKAIQNQPIH